MDTTASENAGAKGLALVDWKSNGDGTAVLESQPDVSVILYFISP